MNQLEQIDIMAAEENAACLLESCMVECELCGFVWCDLNMIWSNSNDRQKMQFLRATLPETKSKSTWKYPQAQKESI